MNIRRWSPRVDLPQNGDLTDLTGLLGTGRSHRRGHSYSWVEISLVERDEAGDVESVDAAGNPSAVRRRTARRAGPRAVKNAVLEADAARIEGPVDRPAPSAPGAGS